MEDQPQPELPTTNRRQFFSAGVRCLAVGGMAAFIASQVFKGKRLAGDPNCIEAVREATQGGVDYAFEMAGSVKALELAASLLQERASMRRRRDQKWSFTKTSPVISGSKSPRLETAPKSPSSKS